MSVWDQIDALKARHDLDFERTARRVSQLGGGSFRTDEFGRWKCSWRPTSGDRRVVRITARRPAELVANLKAAVRDWKKKRKAEIKGEGRRAEGAEGCGACCDCEGRGGLS